MTPKQKKNLITKDMTMLEILEKNPDAQDVMLSYGLHCVGCHINAYETLQEGVQVHGLTKRDITQLLREINDLSIKKEITTTKRGISLTFHALQKIRDLQKKNKKKRGIFQIEFLDLPNGSKEFFVEMISKASAHQEKIVFGADVTLAVAKGSLKHLKGLVIDYTETNEEEGFQFRQRH